MIYHITGKLFEYGHYGVQLFFTISGFVIFLTAGKVKNTYEFFIKRFLRLYPTYWICVSITFLFIIFFEKIMPLKTYLVNLSMVQELLGYENLDWSYWSLLPELFFYAYIGLIIFFKKLDKILWICTIWLLIITLNLVFNIEKYTLIIRLFNIRHGQMFVAGILFYKLFANSEKKAMLYTLLAASYLLAICVYKNQFPLTEVIIVISIIYSTFLLLINNKLTFLQNRGLIFLGSISYPLYLIHQKIFIILSPHFSTQFFYLNVIVYSVFFILVAYLVHILVEKPAARFSRYLLK